MKKKVKNSYEIDTGHDFVFLSAFIGFVIGIIACVIFAACSSVKIEDSETDTAAEKRFVAYVWSNGECVEKIDNIAKFRPGSSYMYIVLEDGSQCYITNGSTCIIKEERR